MVKKQGKQDMIKQLHSFLGKSWEEIQSLEGFPEIIEQHPLAQVEDQYYLELPEHGLEMVFSTNQDLTSLHFYSEHYEGFSQYQGELPRGLEFQDSRGQVHRNLGRPTTSGGGEEIAVFGKTPEWDRYDSSKDSVHIQYHDSGDSFTMLSITLIADATDLTPSI